MKIMTDDMYFFQAIFKYFIIIIIIFFTAFFLGCGGIKVIMFLI